MNKKHFGQEEQAWNLWWANKALECWCLKLG